MTALTPQQMRELANEWQQQLHDAAMTQSEKDKRERTVAAFRTAADQLEAVRATLDRYAVTDDYNPGTEWTEPEDVWRLFRDLRATLTADTAPQEDRDE